MVLIAAILELRTVAARLSRGTILRIEIYRHSKSVGQEYNSILGIRSSLAMTIGTGLLENGFQC